MKSRESNFELLRLVAILMVVIGHLCMTYLKVARDSGDFVSSWSNVGVLFLGRCCGIAVDVFILISGYFGIKPKWKSIFNFIYLILFWRATMFFLQYAFGYVDLSTKSMVSGLNFLNIWFIRDYIILMLVAPLLNAFCEMTSQKGLLKYIIVFYLLAFSADFIIPIKLWGVFHGGYSAIWFVGLYLIGRYIGRYGLGKCEFKIKYNFMIYLGLAIISTVFMWALYKINAGEMIIGRAGCLVGYYTSPFVMLGAVAIFQCFRKARFSSNIVNHFALSAFAIYLSHSPTAWFWQLSRSLISGGGAQINAVGCMHFCRYNINRSNPYFFLANVL